jgi:hypothetical protein
MAVDYDAPRQTPTDETDDGLDALTVRRSTGKAGIADVDETAEAVESSGLDFVDEELSVPVVPMRGDEFRCARCFLVHHRSRLAAASGPQLCRDCA